MWRHQLAFPKVQFLTYISKRLVPEVQQNYGQCLRNTVTEGVSQEKNNLWAALWSTVPQILPASSMSIYNCSLPQLIMSKMTFVPLGPVSDVTILCKVVNPRRESPSKLIRKLAAWKKLRPPINHCTNHSKVWAAFTYTGTFLVLKGIIQRELQTSCEWVAAEHGSYPLVGGNARTRNSFLFACMEVLHAEIVGWEKWNLWKEKMLKEYVANGCLAFPTKGCPDRSFFCLTADQHPSGAGLKFSSAFFCSRNKNYFRCQLKQLCNCRNSSDAKDHVEKLKWLLEAWRFQFTQGFAFFSPLCQETRKYFVRKSNKSSFGLYLTDNRCK